MTKVRHDKVRRGEWGKLSLFCFNRVLFCFVLFCFDRVMFQPCPSIVQFTKQAVPNKALYDLRKVR